MSKFQKNLLNKVLAFFILMSEHTLVLVVQPPNGQKSYANIHVLLLTPYTYDRVHQGKFSIFRKSITQFWIFWKKIQNKWSGKLAKVEKTPKQAENQQIFIVTLIEKFSVADYWYMLYKFTQYTWALSSSLFRHSLLISNEFLKIFDKKAYFAANRLHIMHMQIKRVKPTTFGNFSVFSVLCHNCSYLSWETSQQKVLWKFLFTMASPNF